MKTDKRIGMDVGYLCHECAVDNGAAWPYKHEATMHMGDCEVCGEHKALCSWDDWTWPVDPWKNARARVTREI